MSYDDAAERYTNLLVHDADTGTREWPGCGWEATTIRVGGDEAS
jgi:hypothetical protein